MAPALQRCLVARLPSLAVGPSFILVATIKRALEGTTRLVLPQLLPVEVDVLEMVLAVISWQAFLLVGDLGLALDKVPLEALLGHLVLLVVGANHLLVIESLHFSVFLFIKFLELCYY